jgi:hypothetical protein
MLELFILVLVVGFVLYYLIRHPLKSLKYAGAGLGLMVLGIAGISGLIVLCAALIS